MPRCLLPHRERDDLRADITSAQADFSESKGLILRIYGYALKGMSRISPEDFEKLVEEMLDRHDELISSQNIALRAGLTAEGERWGK